MKFEYGFAYQNGSLWMLSSLISNAQLIYIFYGGLLVLFPLEIDNLRRERFKVVLI